MTSHNIAQIEEWRPIPGWPYEISSCGDVRRTHKGSNGLGCMAKMSKHFNRFNGYQSVMLKNCGRSTRKTIHLMVCTAFHGPKPSPTHQVAHWDGNKLNNHFSNLRWATPGENREDSRRHGTLACGPRGGGARLTIEQARAIFVATGTHKSIADIFGICRAHVSDIKNRKKWKHFTSDLCTI